MIKILEETMNQDTMVRIMAEEISDLEEAIGQAARDKNSQVSQQLIARMKRNAVDEFLDIYFPDGEFSLGALNRGGVPIEKYLANKPEDLISLKSKIVGYIKQALETQEVEAPNGFGDDWISTPAQLPAVELTPPAQPEEKEGDFGRSIDEDIRQQFEMRLKDIVPEEAVAPFLLFFTLLSKQNIREEVSLAAALQSANMLVGKSASQVRESLMMMGKDDRMVVLREFKKLDSTKQTYIVDMLKEVIPEKPAKVEPEIIEPEEAAAEKTPEEPEDEEIPITAKDLDSVKDPIETFFSEEKDKGFMKQLFLSNQSEVLMGFMNALRALLSGYGKAKAITEEQSEELDISTLERRAIVRDMKNIKITMNDLVDLVGRYNKYKTRVSPDTRFDGTKLKRKVQEELEDTQLAIAKLYKRIVDVILSGEDVIKEEVGDISPEDKANNVRRVYGELLNVYNNTFGPIISGKASFDEFSIRDAAETSMQVIIDSGIVDYFPAQRFSPKVDPETTLDDAMRHLTGSLKELASFISKAFARVNTNDVTEAQARTFLKRLRGIAQVLELDFGADSMINALPEAEEENPEAALSATPEGFGTEYGPGLSEPWPSANLQEQLIPLVEKIIKDHHG